MKEPSILKSIFEMDFVSNTVIRYENLFFFKKNDRVILP